MTKDEALQTCGDPTARRGIRALYKLAQLLSHEELNNVQTKIKQLGLSGMPAVAFLERYLALEEHLKEARSG